MICVISKTIFRQFLKFHLISLSGIFIRLLVFTLFISLNVPWEISLFLSTGFVVLLNFLGFELIVFSNNSWDVQNNSSSYQVYGYGFQSLETIEEARLYNQWIAGKIQNYLGDNNLEFGSGLGTISSLISENADFYNAWINYYNAL
jgi:hypothetical protein